MEMKIINENLNFNSLCSLLDKLEEICSAKLSTNNQRALYTKAFYLFFKQQVNGVALMEQLLDCFEQTFRLLTPCQDKDRKYSIREFTLSKLLLDAFRLEPRSDIGKLLINWNKPLCEYQQSAGQGNLGTVVEQVAKLITPLKRDPHSVIYVANLLNQLALHSKYSTIADEDKPSDYITPQHNIIQTLYLGQSPLSCKWITRIILKNLSPLNLEWNEIMNAFHPCMASIHRMFLYINLGNRVYLEHVILWFK
jgi:hypothetical protein